MKANLSQNSNWQDSQRIETSVLLEVQSIRQASHQTAEMNDITEDQQQINQLLADADTVLCPAEVPKTPEYRTSDNEEIMEEEISFPSSQMDAIPKRAITPRAPNNHKATASTSRKRKHSKTVYLETNIENSKDSINKLRRHLENTCQKSLQYAARINILPDDEFKAEIRAIKHKDLFAMECHWCQKSNYVFLRVYYKTDIL